MSELRPYQVTAIDSAIAALSNSGSAVLQMPTGAGKTRAATEIVGQWEGVVWFICHRVEIAQQAAKAFRAAGIDFGMISPRAIDPDTDKPYPLEPKKLVQIITIGTLPRLLAELPAPSLVIWDECHHVAAKSWADIREMLTDAKHLGLTATPERLDGKGLSKWFAELVVGPTIESLITDEWLSPFRYFAPSDPDLSAAKMQAGDYNKKDLAKVMNTPVLIGDAVAEYRRVADGKRAIAFCASKEASMALVERFNAEGVPALHVDGNTHATARREAVAALAAGNIKVLSNVEVFTEGFDVPGIEAVILLRPTKSPTLLLQMIGRALRFVEGKTAVIMDHAGLWQDHGSFAADWHWSLQGGAAKARRMAGVCGPRRCPKCSNVPFERVPVCANCGYEFPTGREIGEYDGVLTEVRGVVPEGCVTRTEFARRHNVNPCTPSDWMKRGLPNRSGFIPVLDGDAWVAKHARANCPIGYVSQLEFSKRHGVSSAAPRGWIGRGLPVQDGYIPIREGDSWVSENVKRIGSPPEGSETPAGFARIAGVGSTTVYRMIRKGLPVGEHGLINIEAGLSWIESAKRPKDFPPTDVSDPENYLRRSDFMNFAGLSKETVRAMIKRGIPTAGNGWIHKIHGLDWMRDNWQVQQVPAPNPKFESKSAFSRRIGLSTPTVQAMIEAGLPIDEFNRIQIDLAVDWVKKKWASPNSKPMDVDDPEEYVATHVFAKACDVSPQTVSKWRDMGIPHARNGWIHKSEGLKWVARNNPEIDGKLSRVDFAKRVGLQSSLIGHLIKKGLPADAHHNVVFDDALEWLKSYDSAYLRPFTVSDPSQYEMAKYFGTRIGLGSKFFKVYDWAKRGLPCASNGWVHIQRGLEWVRDNTSIQIPPEAWPSANDNDAAGDSAAA